MHIGRQAESDKLPVRVQHWGLSTWASGLYDYIYPVVEMPRKKMPNS